MYQTTQTSTGQTVLTQVHVQGQQGIVGSPQVIQIQPVALHPNHQQQTFQVQYQPIAANQLQFQTPVGVTTAQAIPQIQVAASASPTKTTNFGTSGKKKGSKKQSKAKKQLAQQQQQIVAAQYQQVQAQQAQQQQQQLQQQHQQQIVVAQTATPIANRGGAAATLVSPTQLQGNIIATKTEIKQEDQPKVLTVMNKDLEDFEYGPNAEGELNAGCRKCNVVFGTAVELKVHFGAAHNRQTFECFVCNKLFLQKFAFLGHVERYHSDLGNSFPCDHCDKSYTNQKALEIHIQEYHKTAPATATATAAPVAAATAITNVSTISQAAPLICPICNKSFPQKFSLRRHIQNVHENAGTGEDCKHPFKCQTCGKSYKSQSGLTIHSKSKHQNTQYKCELCHKTFSRASNVARHVDTIHNLSKTFPCKWCGKEFRSTGGRDMHVTAEHKAVRYHCQTCGKVFRRKGSLSRHMAGTHGEGNPELFKCHVCSKMFKQKSHLKTHLKNLHGIITPSHKEVEAQRIALAQAQHNSQQQAQTQQVQIPVQQVLQIQSPNGQQQQVATTVTASGQRAVVSQVQPISIIQPQVVQQGTVQTSVGAQYAQPIFIK